MSSLVPVYTIEVHVLIDNVTDSHSTIHDHTESAAGHCSGWCAVNAMTNSLGEEVMSPSVVGKRYTFAAYSALTDARPAAGHL